MSRTSATSATLGAVGTIAALAALAAIVLLDAAPTSWAFMDAAQRGLFAAFCALAGSRARRWTLLWMSAVAVAGSGAWLQVAAILAILAFLAAGATLLLRFRHRVVGASIGAAAGLALLGLERPSATGATVLLGLIAVLPLFVSAYARCRPRTQRMLNASATVAAALALLGAVGAFAFGLQQRSSIETAVATTREAIDAVDPDDPSGTSSRFVHAAEQFEVVEREANRVWMLPARVTPVVGSNVNLVRSATSAGTELNLAAAEMLATTNLKELRTPDGGIDLAVLETIGEPLVRASDRLTSARQELERGLSPWLLPPLRDELDGVLVELVENEDTATTASMAVMRAPSILGADGPRHYLMLLGNPAELRDLGGHIGNWALLTIDDGRIVVEEIGQPYDLADPQTSPPLTLTPGAYPNALVEMRPQYFPQNWGGTADFPTVARLAAELYPQVRDEELDGVMYADPSAFAALLSITGPQPVDGLDLELTSDNAAEFLTTGQFSAFPTELEANQAVTKLIEDVLSAFGATELPPPAQLAEILSPAVRSGGLQFVSFTPEDQELLSRLGMTGHVERPGSGDLLGVIARNTNPSKIDVYLRREIDYRVRWDRASGSLNATLTVTLANDAPTEGLPTVVDSPIPGATPGMNRTTLAVLSPWQVLSATLDGAPAQIGTQQELRGVKRHSTVVELQAGSERQLVLELEGEVGPGAPYLLQLIGQPTVLPGTVDVHVTPDRGPNGLDPVQRRFEASSQDDVLIEVREPNI